MRVVTGDVRYAMRQLIKTPTFTLTALLTLALGIGVNAAMFSVIDQALLRRVPYPDPDRFVQMGAQDQAGKGFNESALPDILDWRARSHAFSAIAYYSVQLPTLGGTNDPHLVAQTATSANFFDVLGIHAAMGRTFVPGDEKAGKTNVLVLSWELWQKFFHGDPKIVGRSVPVNGLQYTVIGVLAEGTDFPENAGGGMMSPLQADNKSYLERDSSFLLALGRLRPGVTVTQAQAELNHIHGQLQKEYPDKEFPNRILVEPYQEVVTGHARPAIVALGGAVLAVWLIACANVAGLMLTRTNSRRREIAIRGALGAGRSRLAQQFLTESLLLSLAGGVLGLAIAWFALRLLSHTLSNAVRHGGDIHIDGMVCLYLLLASCVSALLFGVIPAVHAAQIPAQEGLREGTAAAGTSKRQTLLRDSLVVGEIALTLTLLIAAGLMMRTLWSLRRVDLGFVPQHLVTTTMFLPRHGGEFWMNTDTRQPNLSNTFYHPLLEKLRHIPGIESAGLSTKRALDTSFHGNLGIHIVGRPEPPKNLEQYASASASSADYFRTMGIPLLRGRNFNEGDRIGSEQVVIVNEAFVRKILPGVDPLGNQISMDEDNKQKRATIVGVVANSRQDAVSEEMQPEVHFDLDQLAPGDDMYPILAAFHMDLAVRTNLTSATAVDTITREIHALQPEMALQDAKSMQQVIDDSLSSQTLAARLLGIFGLAALAIAVAGIYGLLSYSVSQRTRELGVRLALGAQRKDVLWLVLKRALVLLGVGVSMGVAIAWATSGVMRSFIYGLQSYDVATAVVVALLLAVCGMAASYFPARKAAATDPIEALRKE